MSRSCSTTVLLLTRASASVDEEQEVMSDTSSHNKAGGRASRAAKRAGKVTIEVDSDECRSSHSAATRLR